MVALPFLVGIGPIVFAWANNAAIVDPGDVALPLAVVTLVTGVSVLVLARILGGVSAGMAYPTTLALITALWSGPARTRSIALWSALGGAIASLGPLASGWLLGQFWWGSVFIVTLPLAVVALVGT